MKKILTILFLSISTIVSCKNDDTTVYHIEPKETHFPKSWEGNWKGEVTIFSANGKQNVSMTLAIQPIDASRWSWTILYEAPNQSPRKYELIQDATGWKIDEKNGIILPQQFLGDRMTSSFSVGGSLLISYYWLENDVLNMEIHAVRQEADSMSEELGVGIHSMGALQQAKLYRK
ncbi:MULTISPECIES: hypothetical protein [unclassified Flavobacterium]|uniref:hypothetical protein n=1 Tax=unclassified Flavobacterium TaxID=196869 RepID=UPI0013D44633|nr:MULTISPECIES: hypothetical protein [unclassified Flavobacterium]MBA5792450.1 hypothetical protein [Flavobacterium sp. xlx-221]